MVDNVLPCDKDTKFFATTILLRYKKARFHMHNDNFNSSKLAEFKLIPYLCKNYVSL